MNRCSSTPSQVIDICFYACDVVDAQVDEIVYAAFDGKQKKYLAQVISIKQHKYNLYYLDGDTKDHVPEKQMKKVPSRQLKDKLAGLKFCDEGDYTPGVKASRAGFKKGEFTVLVKNGGTDNCYWCERETFGDDIQEKREIELFEGGYIDYTCVR